MNIRYVAAALAAAAISSSSGTAHAKALGSGNVLGSYLNTGHLVEYNTAGTVVQDVYVPPPVRPWNFEDTRDIVVDAYGNVQIFHGTEHPYLTTWDPRSGVFTHHTAPNWGISSGSSAGGLATFGQYVFAPTTGPNGGIIRFDIANNYAADQPVADGNYLRLTMGWDGLLYALPPNWVLPDVGIRVYDPFTMQLQRSVKPALSFPDSDVRGIAVDRSGVIYLATWYGRIIKVDAFGNTLQSVQTQSVNLTDVDLSQEGYLVTGAFAPYGGRALLGYSSLSYLRYLGPTPDCAAFTRSPAVVPEPGTAGLLAAAALPGVLRRSRRHTGSARKK